MFQGTRQHFLNLSTESEGGGRIPLPGEMADKLCGFNYLVYGLKEGVGGGGLFVFIHHRNKKMYLIKT